MERWKVNLLRPLRSRTIDATLWEDQTTGVYYALLEPELLTGYNIVGEAYLTEVGSGHPANRERLTEVVFPQ